MKRKRNIGNKVVVFILLSIINRISCSSSPNSLDSSPPNSLDSNSAPSSIHSNGSSIQNNSNASLDPLREEIFSKIYYKEKKRPNRSEILTLDEIDLLPSDSIQSLVKSQHLKSLLTFDNNFPTLERFEKPTKGVLFHDIINTSVQAGITDQNTKSFSKNHVRLLKKELKRTLNEILVKFYTEQKARKEAKEPLKYEKAQDIIKNQPFINLNSHLEKGFIQKTIEACFEKDDEVETNTNLLGSLLVEAIGRSLTVVLETDNEDILKYAKEYFDGVSEYSKRLGLDAATHANDQKNSSTGTPDNITTVCESLEENMWVKYTNWFFEIATLVYDEKKDSGNLTDQEIEEIVNNKKNTIDSIIDNNNSFKSFFSVPNELGNACIQIVNSIMEFPVFKDGANKTRHKMQIGEIEKCNIVKVDSMMHQNKTYIDGLKSYKKEFFGITKKLIETIKADFKGIQFLNSGIINNLESKKNVFLSKANLLHALAPELRKHLESNSMMAKIEYENSIVSTVNRQINTLLTNSASGTSTQVEQTIANQYNEYRNINSILTHKDIFQRFLLQRIEKCVQEYIDKANLILAIKNFVIGHIKEYTTILYKLKNIMGLVNSLANGSEKVLRAQKEDLISRTGIEEKYDYSKCEYVPTPESRFSIVCLCLVQKIVGSPCINTSSIQLSETNAMKIETALDEKIKEIEKDTDTEAEKMNVNKQYTYVLKKLYNLVRRDFVEIKNSIKDTCENSAEYNSKDYGTYANLVVSRVPEEYKKTITDEIEEDIHDFDVDKTKDYTEYITHFNANFDNTYEKILEKLIACSLKDIGLEFSTDKDNTLVKELIKIVLDNLNAFSDVFSRIESISFDDFVKELTAKNTALKETWDKYSSPTDDTLTSSIA
ncbi:hypothetical protein NEMIN01_0811 [Nematocida minor]|uniref:uncharacterized protein n=1 Tax=Nematocida minor TaxID=1912983 RepID=UPI002220DB8E|nr:uncharacterized protein NEMIN01_0811 [Nematocida minor]KAI5190026.1 hypothetical protein NEMIN01_0811 [Nematocida minor]